MDNFNEKVIGSPTVTPMAVPDYNQSDSRKADHIKNRPFYDYVEETTNETVTLKLYSDDSTSWNSYLPKATGEYLGLKVGNNYQMSLRCYDSERNLLAEHDTTVAADNNGLIDGVCLGWQADGFDIFIWDKSSTDYRNEYPEIFDLLDVWSMVIPDLYIYDGSISFVEIDITGDFSRVMSKLMHKKYIPRDIARRSEVLALKGDMESILDEIHEYAQSLIGGES